jgi:hypothetical protein
VEVLPGYTSVKALIYGDNSGGRIELPILVSYDGPVKPLLQYQLLHQSNSHSWHVKLHQAVRLLLLYAAANPDSYLTPVNFLPAFLCALFPHDRNGRIGPERSLLDSEASISRATNGQNADRVLCLVGQSGEDGRFRGQVSAG